MDTYIQIISMSAIIIMAIVLILFSKNKASAAKAGILLISLKSQYPNWLEFLDEVEKRIKAGEFDTLAKDMISALIDMSKSETLQGKKDDLFELIDLLRSRK